MAKGTITSLVVGGAIGAVTALLLAPKTGTEMRQDLAVRYRGLSDKTMDVASTVGQKATDLAKSVSASASDIAKSVSSQASDIVGQAKDSSKSVVDEVKNSSSHPGSSSINSTPTM